MKKTPGFSLLEVLLAVILIMIVTFGSYALVKNFRSASATQQLVRYSTTIAENYMPFLDGSASTSVKSEDKLSRSFLESIHILSADLVNCDNNFCYVRSGLYVQGGSDEIPMKFDVMSDSDTKVNFFVIILDQLTSKQKDQILQSSGSVFSLYCGQVRCLLGSDTNFAGTIKMVFPKAEGPI